VALALALLSGLAMAATDRGRHRARAAGAPRPEAVRASALVAARAGASDDDAPFQETTTSIGQVGLAITNFGFFGNNFRTRSPSFEYPLGSDVEHMVRGGVWIGAIRADTGDTLLASGTSDGQVGADTDAATEYHPTSRIVRRSILINDRNYSPEAVSEEDFVTAYADTIPIERPNEEDHHPMGIEVLQQVYGWSFDPANGFVIVQVQVVNLNEDVDLLDVHIGMYAELASGYKGGYEDWPPGGAWFDQKILEFDPERWVVFEHNVDFDGGDAPQYGAIGLLGTRPQPVSEMSRSFRWWAWDPGNAERDTDVERYITLATPGADDVSSIQLRDDPAELLGVGPWPILAPGDTATAAFAFIGGNDVADAQAKFDWAKTAFDRNYIVPLPPPSPRLVADPRPGGVTVRWDHSPESVRDAASDTLDFAGYRLYVSDGTTGETGLDWSQVLEADVAGDSIGFETGLDFVADPFISETGDSLHYRFDIDGLRDGYKYFVSITSFDFGDVATNTPPLESGTSQNRTAIIPGADPDPGGTLGVVVYPNPYRGRASWDGTLERERFIWFANLPPRAEIRIYTLGGDWVETIDFDAATYSGANAAGVYDPGAFQDRPVLAGGLAAWNLLNWNSRPVGTGLYLYVVRDRDSGRMQSGRFMVLK
jgi:hypothetical protein